LSILRLKVVESEYRTDDRGDFASVIIVFVIEKLNPLSIKATAPTFAVGFVILTDSKEIFM
jgi:hypothetical protein